MVTDDKKIPDPFKDPAEYAAWVEAGNKALVDDYERELKEYDLF